MEAIATGNSVETKTQAYEDCIVALFAMHDGWCESSAPTAL